MVARLYPVLGVACIVFSFQVERIAPTILEAVNKVGSMFNGPLLALFVTALLLRNVPQRFALSGFVLGLLTNLGLALGLRRYLGLVERGGFWLRCCG